MDTTTTTTVLSSNADLIKWVITGVVIVSLFFFGGAAALVITFLRTRKADLERAFEAAPPETQAFVNDLVKGFGELTNVLSGFVARLTEAVTLARDVTDHDPNTPTLESMKAQIADIHNATRLLTMPKEPSADIQALRNDINALSAQFPRVRSTPPEMFEASTSDDTMG